MNKLHLKKRFAVSLYQMRYIYLSIYILLLLAMPFAASAQSANEVVATSRERSFTLDELPANVADSYRQLDNNTRRLRVELLGEQIAEILFETEAKLTGTTPAKLIEAEMAKRVPAPPETEVKAVYGANAAAIGNRTLAEVRPQIIDFLTRDARAKALEAYVSALKTKHKVAIGKDVNSAALAAADVLATIGARQLTVKDFDEKAAFDLYEYRAETIEHVIEAVEGVAFSALVLAEAKKQDLPVENYMAREITDKMRDYSEDERDMLESSLRDKLFRDYAFKSTLMMPAPLVQKVSGDDDPGSGPLSAPVTVVMFSDFQCPACAATHPVLKKVIGQYGDKIRFVVRDFPLTQAHANAMKAAQAAGAANAQGKFFEYIEFLYQNQDALDTESLKKYALQAKLDVQKFTADLESGRFEAEIRKDMADGESYKVRSTPTIFVNGVRVRHLSASTFKKAIDQALAR